MDNIQGWAKVCLDRYSEPKDKEFFQGVLSVRRHMLGIVDDAASGETKLDRSEYSDEYRYAIKESVKTLLEMLKRLDNVR